MRSLEAWLEDIQKICPPFVKVFCEQTAEVQQKIVELIAHRHSFVLRHDYDRQTQLYEQLKQKTQALELKVDALIEAKTASSDHRDA